MPNYAKWDNTRKSNEKLISSVEEHMEQQKFDTAELAHAAGIKESVVEGFLDGETVGHIAVVKIAGAFNCELGLIPRTNG